MAEELAGMKADLPSFQILLGEIVNSWVKLERMKLEWERVTENVGFAVRPIWKQNGLLPPTSCQSGQC